MFFFQSKLICANNPLKDHPETKLKETKQIYTQHSKQQQIYTVTCNKQRLLRTTSNRADLQQYTPADDRGRESKRDPAGNLSTHANPRTPADNKERERKREPTRIPDLSLYSARKRARAWVLVGNPDNLPRSGRKPTHTGVGLTNPALHLQHSLPLSCFRRSDLVVPSKSRCSV
jgi:hypothetical protein